MMNITHIGRIALLIVFFPFFFSHAQVTNRALLFNQSGDSFRCELPELSELKEYTLQLMMSPQEWVPGASLFKIGEGTEEFSAKLSSTQGNVIFTIGNQQLIATGVAATGWTQLTLSVVSTGADVWVNRKKINKTWHPNIHFQLPKWSKSQSFDIGTNYKGRIDEFRVWNVALPSNNVSDLMFYNTVNKYHPHWNNLIAYYQFDQKLPNQKISRVEVTDNDNFRYHIVSGYSDFNRHSDRLQIDSDMHLLVNDLILLVGHVSDKDGSIKMSKPDNQGLLTKVNQLADYKGRTGVLCFMGDGAKMNVGTEILKEGIKPHKENATFEGWFYVEKWKKGANLLLKKESNTKYVKISLGNEAKGEIVVDVNRNVFRTYNVIKTGEWKFIATVFNSQSVEPKEALYLINEKGKVLSPKVCPKKLINFSPKGICAETLIGENFDGKMDEIMIWRTERSASQVVNDALGKSRDMKFPGGGPNNRFFDAYWKADDAANPGKDTQGWISMIKKIKEQYGKHQGYKIRIGLVTEDVGNKKNWVQSITRESWRTRLAQDVKNVLLPHCDGVDVDFEWLYAGDTRWADYGKMVKALRDVIPSDKVFSVSLHPVSYWIPKEYLDLPDYYTFQNYGPRKGVFSYKAYTKSYADFHEWGFKDSKILLSVPTIATTGEKVRGYKDVLAANPRLALNMNEAMIGDKSYTFTGVDMTKERTMFNLTHKLGGVMFFDMGNDVAVQSKHSLIRAINSIMSSNVAY
ncbi:MAG: glycoside hydrolase family 18 protein [Bacteroides sp.]